MPQLDASCSGGVEELLSVEFVGDFESLEASSSLTSAGGVAGVDAVWEAVFDSSASPSFASSFTIADEGDDDLE